MKFIALLAVTTAAVAAVPAMAQSNDRSEHFNGGYISVVGGKTLQNNDTGESLVFDTDGDGVYDDTAAPFLSGCNGAGTASNSTVCRNDKDGAEYYARVGVDRRSGNFVVGALLEAGRNESVDAVTGFTPTDFYTMSRKAKWNAGARLRAGYTPNGGALFYVTGGGAYARLNNRFSTTSNLTTISDSGNSNAWGWSAGGGAEVMLAKNLSLGVEYLYTDVKDDDYSANISTIATPVASLADVQRSSDHFRTHSVRGSLNFRF
jgi:outer membrane immunogenic protein